MRRHPNKKSGFTLLELLVAIAIAAIVALSLYAAMTSAFRARASARAQVDGVAGAMIALDVIGQDLQSVLPPSPAPADDSADDAAAAAGDVGGPMIGPFVGTSQNGPNGPTSTVNFFALGREEAGPAAGQATDAINPTNATNDPSAADPLSDGVRQVELALDTTTTPPRLVRRIRRNLLSDAALDVRDETLLSGVRAFGLRYYDGANWLDEWDSIQQGDVLPYAVEITLELDRPSPTDPSRYYRVTQVLPIACAKPPATDTTATATP